MGTQTTATSTNTANFNGQTSFQNPPRGVTSTNGPTGPSNNRYSQPPNKGLGKKASKHNLNYTQPSTSAIFTQPIYSYCRSVVITTDQVLAQLHINQVSHLSDRHKHPISRILYHTSHKPSNPYWQEHLPIKYVNPYPTG